MPGTREESRSDPARAGNAAAVAAAVLAAPTYTRFRSALLESACKRCGLAAGRTRIVVDRGNPGAIAMAIGEGPGADEDREGRCFVGRSGKLLDAAMAEAGLDSERDFLIANIVKCRPEANRVPSREEAAACLPYLARQIELVRPRLIALLGATPSRHLLAPAESRLSISKIAGRAAASASLPGVELWPLFHPAYILRDPRKRPLLVEHLRALRRRLREIESE